MKVECYSIEYNDHDKLTGAITQSSYRPLAPFYFDNNKNNENEALPIQTFRTPVPNNT